MVSNKIIIQELLKDNLGVVICMNLVHAVRCGLLRENVVKEVLHQWWMPFLNGAKSLSLDSLLGLYESTILERAAKGKNSFCQSVFRRENEQETHTGFYTIKSYHSCWMHVLSGAYFEGSHDFLPDPQSNSFERVINEYLAVGMFEKKLCIESSSTFSREYGVYWICPQDNLRPFLTDSDRATRIRDFLGLAHFNVDDYLIAVKITPDHVSNDSDKTMAIRPTPIDAGLHNRFKCISDSHGAGSKHEYGLTFDMKKQVQELGNSDGGKEYVVSESKAKKVSKFEMMPLGWVGKPSNTSHAADIDFISRLESIGGISRDDIESDLERIML